MNGDLVWTKKNKKGKGNQSYKGSVEIPSGGWITVRVSGGESEWPMMDSYPFAESSPIWFGAIGSTMPISKIESAKKLLKALNISEQRLKDGYGDNPIPNLLAHFDNARQKLLKIIEE